MNNSKDLNTTNATVEETTPQTTTSSKAEEASKNLPTIADFTKGDAEDENFMKYMTKEHVLEVMSVPSYSYAEFRIVTYLIIWCRARGLQYEFDSYGNFYITKGELKDDEFYPCVTSHLDTVQDKQESYANAGLTIPIKEVEDKGKHKIYVDGMGIGADCRAGITICLALIEKFDTIKACFFLQEECGMIGSSKLDTDWFKNVGYVIGYDSPDLNRAAWKCSDEKLFDLDFFKEHLEPICDKWGLNDFRSEPITDVVQIRKKTDITCMNFGNGGYNAHLSNEYCYLEDMDHACGMGEDIIKGLGNKKYACSNDSGYSDSSYYDKKAGRTTYQYGGGSSTSRGTYSYSGGTSSTHIPSSSTSGSSTSSSTSTSKPNDNLISVDAIEYVSTIYEERLKSIEEAIKAKCKEMNVDFDTNFSQLFKEEITF